MKKTLMEEIEKIKKEYKNIGEINTISNYFDEVLKIEEFYTEGKEFVFNILISKINLYRHVVFEVGKLKREIIEYDPFEKEIDDEIIFKNSKNEIDCICNEGLLEIRKFLVMVYYTRHCFINNDFGKITFSEYIKKRTGKNYSINTIKFNSDLESGIVYDSPLKKINEKYLVSPNDDEKVFKAEYDRIEKKIKKFEREVSYKGISAKIPIYSKKDSLILEDDIGIKNMVAYETKTGKYKEIEEKVKDKLTNYSSVYLPISAIDDLNFIFDELSNYLAFKRFQSGKIEKIKEKDLKELKKATMNFFIDIKKNTHNEALIKVNNIFQIKDSNIEKEENYFNNIEKILKDTLEEFIYELSNFQYPYIEKNNREELANLREKEKMIIEKYIIEPLYVSNF